MTQVMLQASICQRPMRTVGFQREGGGRRILYYSGGSQAIWKRWYWYVYGCMLEILAYYLRCSLVHDRNRSFDVYPSVPRTGCQGEQSREQPREQSSIPAICYRTLVICYRTLDICFLRHLLYLHVPFPHDNHTCDHHTSLLRKYRV